VGHIEPVKAPADQRHKRVAVVANATLAYPFFVAGSLYGCWLLACRILGHPPVAWVDDPAETLSAGGLGWLYDVVTWLAIVPMVPIFIASVACNIVYVVRTRHSAVQAGIRAFTVSGVWLWLWTWIATDPHEINKWWLD